MTGSGQGEVLLRSSISPLAELYKTERFKTAWANEVRFHVARNLLHLRRYRRLSQGRVAKAMGTSQSAVARIESGQENITEDTLQRMIGALDGQFYVSIHPRELRCWHERPWWESLGSEKTFGTSWNLKAIASKQSEGMSEILILFQCPATATLPARELLSETQIS
jgi:transcriptional regulator with XRE-family HTH domain